MKSNRNDKTVSQPFKDSNFGNHKGLDGLQTLKQDSPNIDFGKPRGDNNRGSKGSQSQNGYFD